MSNPKLDEGMLFKAIVDRLTTLKPEDEPSCVITHDVDALTDLHAYIARSLVDTLLPHTGYDLDSERRVRIAQTMRELVEVGFPASLAFYEALDAEILLYGDPKATGEEPVGILNNPPLKGR